MPRTKKETAHPLFTSPGRHPSDRLLDETIAIWQPRSRRKLTHEDAREILENLTGFFQVLSVWQREERAKEAEEKLPEPHTLPVVSNNRRGGGYRFDFLLPTRSTCIISKCRFSYVA